MTGRFPIPWSACDRKIPDACTSGRDRKLDDGGMRRSQAACVGRRQCSPAPRWSGTASEPASPPAPGMAGRARIGAPPQAPAPFPQTPLPAPAECPSPNSGTASELAVGSRNDKNRVFRPRDEWDLSQSAGRGRDSALPVEGGAVCVLDSSGVCDQARQLGGILAVLLPRDAVLRYRWTNIPFCVKNLRFPKYESAELQVNCM